MAILSSGGQKDYLDAPDTAGRPMSVLSLIMVFILIALLTLALFVGGRWAYDQFVKKDDSSQVANTGDKDDRSAGGQAGSASDQAGGQAGSEGQPQSTPGDANGQTSDSTEESASGTGASDSSASDSQSTGTTGSDGSDSSTSSQSSGAASDSQSSAQTQATGQSQISGTGPSPEEVPNTGPGSVLAIFIATTVIATLTHSLVFQKIRK